MSEIENLEREIAALEQVQNLLPDNGHIELALETRRARLAELRAGEVDLFLIEAREICALHMERRDCLAAAARHRDGSWDNTPTHEIALSAIRRGIELAALPLAPVAGMSEEEIEALARECSDKAYETHKAPPASYTARQAARLAIRETLRRAPKAWPSDIPTTGAMAPRCDFLCHIAEQDITA